MVDGDIGILYSKVGKLDERVTKMESTRPYLENLVERSVASNEKLADAIQQMQIAITEMNEKIDFQGESLSDMKKEMEESGKRTSVRLEQVDKQIDSIKEKGKFDITAWIKQNFPWLIIIVGGAIAYFGQFFKF